MLFNSLDFAIFLPIVFFIYWFGVHKNLKAQNFFNVVASYVFYGWWDWRFLTLILFSTLVDFWVGQRMSHAQERARKVFLWVSVLINLGFLGLFKYYNFFVDSFIDAFSFFGMNIRPNSLNIILPVGISFYTFQTLSYSIDVYRKKLNPSSDFIAFSAFVSFFPQLVAGPIERATHLLPQFYKNRKFNYSEAVNGLRQILWGLFKKLVIADNCAEYANIIFNNSDDASGSTLVLGAVFFAFQIYGDFSGYSDIAIGTSRLFGFDLKRNFAYPYFSRDIAEFWRRWHISLSTWFRDYLYIPIGGSKGSKILKVRNTLIIFLVSGFWHGANWTFIFWGLINALYFLPLLLSNRNRNNLDNIANNRLLPTLKEFCQIIWTFSLTALAWIFFRSESLHQACHYIRGIFTTSLFSKPVFDGASASYITLAIVAIFIVIEWLGRQDEFAIEKLGLSWKRGIRWSLYVFVIFIIGMFTQTEETPFIYFQF